MLKYKRMFFNQILTSLGEGSAGNAGVAVRLILRAMRCSEHCLNFLILYSRMT